MQYVKLSAVLIVNSVSSIDYPSYIW